MHYLPQTLNEYDRFQRIASVLKDTALDPDLKGRLDHFLYRATCVLTGLEQIHAAERDTVFLARQYTKQLNFPANRRVAISARPLFDAYAQIPAVLSQLVSMQNMILPMVQGVFRLKRSVPSSLRDGISKGLGKFRVRADLSELIVAYWEHDGRLIRDLRDLNEHFVALVDHTFFEYKQEPGVVLVLLPDNPETKSPKKFTYTQERDAYETLKSGFENLEGLFDRVLERASYPKVAFSDSLHLAQQGDLEPPQNRTLGIMVRVTKVEENGANRKLFLDALEVQQVVPMDGGGNVAFRQLKVDSETEF